MTDDLVALGRRAVACAGWRWMAGMLALSFPGMLIRVKAVDENMAAVLYHGDAVPDLSDPATLGCLLHLVRQAWGCSRMACWPMERMDERKGWGCVAGNGDGVGPWAPTEAGALVAALEEAP